MNDIKSVVAIVNYNDMILVGKKRTDSKKILAGEWHIPGGKVDKNETFEDALAREIMEETGINIQVGRYICSSTTPTSKREVRWYECFAKSSKIVVGSDLENAKWVPKKEVLSVCGEKAISFWSKEIIDYFNT